MFLSDLKFLSEEKNAPILNRNNGFLQAENSYQIIERTRDWTQLVGGVRGFEVKEIIPTKHERIINADAERIFVGKERRKTLVKLLSSYENKFNDYQQGLSLVSGFLLLSLKEQEVSDIITALASNPKYIPNYWQEEAVTEAIDAYVFFFLLERHFPEIAAHIKKNLLMPETFCHKWFLALTVDVLPFRVLYRFFEHFLDQGYLYLFKFGLSLMSTCKNQILQSGDFEILKILRYDKELQKGTEISDDTMLEVVEMASRFDLGPLNIHEVRESVYQEHLKERLEKAKKANQKKDSEDTDDDTEDDSHDSSEEGGVECAVCKENAPDMWCKSCVKFLCERCHGSSAGGHDPKKHKVDEQWEKYEKGGEGDD